MEDWAKMGKSRTKLLNAKYHLLWRFAIDQTNFSIINS